ncbi:MAG: NFACT family protein [Armatimonadota bacterium]
MNYDSFCMAAALDELRRDAVGAFVDQVYQPHALDVVLAFTGRGPRRLWLFSSDARWPRAHATRIRRENPATPPGFCMLLRKRIGGSRLVEAEQVRFDRILRLTFRRGEESHTLVHEVMGRYSNLILLDEAGVVLGAAKVVPPSQTRVRPVLPGQPYEEPPGERPDPRTLSRAELAALLGGADEPAAITRALSGWGTFAAREAFALAEDPSPEGVAAAVDSMMERVRRRDFSPVLFQDPAGKPKGIWAFPSRQSGWETFVGVESVSAACDRFYSFREEHEAVETLRRTALGALERALRTAETQLSEAEGHLEGLDAAEQLRISGELLAAHSGKVERGDTEVELPNWYDPEGGTLRIALDPELDGRENAERCFHRYRRAVAAAEASLERIPALQARVAELRSRVEEAGSADETHLRALHELAKREGLLRTQGPAAQARPEAEAFPAGVRIRRVPVRDWEVLYGENATSNDYLTTRVARPGDLWLHARAVTGAHVVVRGVQSLDRLPSEVLREAARLAARHSEAKHSGVVAVDYTFRKYVRKPRGSAPGACLYTHEKTLHVEAAE